MDFAIQGRSLTEKSSMEPTVGKEDCIMAKIVLIQGHPDHTTRHFGHALLEAYSEGATSAGHEVRIVAVAALQFPFLRSQADFDHGEVPESLRSAQTDLNWSNHVVLFFPLWLGEAPAMLKAFLEQILRPGFAFKPEGKNPMGAKGLKGRSARIICTMGMPALIYRWYFWNHGIRSLNRTVLQFVGFHPVREMLIGQVGDMNDKKAQVWFAEMRRLGKKAE
jgi:putative NADPH-quinone reductase